MSPTYLDACADQDLAVCPYSPLAGGFLTGKYDRAVDVTLSDDQFERIEDARYDEAGENATERSRGASPASRSDSVPGC